jgi:hypothetical protein
VDGIYLLPTFCAVAAVASFAVFLLLESCFSLTAKRIMPVLCIWSALAGHRISIEAAVFLSTGPAPCLSAALAHVEFILVVEATGKDIVTRGILERPTPTPGTALRIC